MLMSTYDADYFLWTQEQATALRSLRQTNALDIDHLAEEIEDMGRSELNKVASLLTQMLVHLMKLRHASETNARGHWLEEIMAFQAAARRAYTPGMRQRLDLDDIWRDACRIVEAAGTGAVFPNSTIPFTLDQLLDRSFDPVTLLAPLPAS